MSKRLAALALLAASCALPGIASAAAEGQSGPGPQIAKPMFTALPQHGNLQANQNSKKPVGQLPQWNGSYTDLTGKTITFTQIGGNPANTDTTTTITVLLIPVKFKITQGGQVYTFDPAKVKLQNNNNRSVVKAMIDSPLFNSKINFAPQAGTCTPSCVDLGKTQYEDAFQRGTWWGANVGQNTSYHVVYTTKVEPEQTITLSCSKCVVSNPFGSGIVGEFQINSMDHDIQQFMSNIPDINAGVLPLFISYDIYLLSGNSCCIGGYHSAISGQPNGQTYSYATYVDTVGAFSQDVSAFSHELGEWMDDPFVENNVNCTDNSIMEVGDPLETGPNYGGYPYTDHNFTYNLQSLVYMGYFGAPTSDSANNWYALQDDMNHVCPGQ
jgi:hypothetical protein